MHAQTPATEKAHLTDQGCISRPRPGLWDGSPQVLSLSIELESVFSSIILKVFK